MDLELSTLRVDSKGIKNQYTVCRGDGIPAFEEAANNLMKEGYIPIGGITVIPRGKGNISTFLQSFIFQTTTKTQ